MYTPSITFRFREDIRQTRIDCAEGRATPLRAISLQDQDAVLDYDPTDTLPPGRDEAPEDAPPADDDVRVPGNDKPAVPEED